VRRRLWTLIPLVAALVACRSHLAFGLVADAKFLIAENSFLTPSQLWANASHDYFWSSSGNSIPYYRPFTKISWVLEAALGGRRPSVFHAVQVAWFLVAIAALLWLARELGLRRRYAALAGVLFALHPAVAEPVALVMARSDVVATAGSIAALAAFRTFVRTRRRRYLVLHAVAFAVAIASKESAIVVPPLITLWLLLDRRRPWGALAPSWALAVLYFVVRARVVGGTGLALDPLRWFVGGGLSIAATGKLLLETGVRNVSRGEAVGLAALATAAVGWGAALTIAACGRRRRALFVLVAWMVASIAMVLLPRAVYVPNAEGKIALADRWLLPAVAAASLIAAVFAQTFLRGRGPLAVLGLVAVWAAVMMTFAPTLRAYYASDEALLDLEDHVFATTPAKFRTLDDTCRANDRIIARQLARGEARSAIGTLERMTQCSPTFDRQFNRLAALVAIGRFEEARPLANALVARTDGDARMRPRAFYLAGLAALESGDVRSAELRFAEAARLGFRACELLAQRARVAMMLEHPVEGAERFEQAYACTEQAGKPQRMFLLLAARAWNEAGRPADAARVQSRATAP